MIKLNVSIFDLAYTQVLKEKRAGKTIKSDMLATLDRAIKIRHYLDNVNKTKKAREIKLKKLANRT